MVSIPKTLKNLLHNFMQLFTSGEFGGEDYKSKLLDAALDDEERQDLQDLFAATAEFYAERRAIAGSKLTPSDYLFNLYLSYWKEEHPDATDDEIKEAVKEYETIISGGVVKELEYLEDDSHELSASLENDWGADDDIESVGNEQNN